MDDFARKVIGYIEDVEFPNIGREIKKNQVLFTVKQGKRTIPFKTPVSGKILKINSELAKDIELLKSTSYGKNWICTIDADNLDNDLKDMKIGKGAISFFQEEIQDCKTHIKEIWLQKYSDNKLAENNGKIIGAIEKMQDVDIEEVVNKFFNKSAI